jgi:predicted ATP-grasp superfamily ATP-dependent carboligase
LRRAAGELRCAPRKEPAVDERHFLTRAAATPPALVLQASYANGLGVIRDLAREGVPVMALDPSRRALGFASRFAAARLVPNPAANEEGFLRALEALGRTLPQRAVVFPTHDEYVWALSRNAQRLAPWYRIPFSGWQAMERVADKEEQLRAAWRAGVDTPTTVFVHTGADLAGPEVDALQFPVIFKPAESLAFKQRFRRPVLEIPSREALPEVYARVDDCGTLMLQEIVPGGDEELYTVGSYLDEQSQALAVFTGRKLRQHPRRFGTSRFAESRWLPDLAEAGILLLRELDFHGVSQVEFKRDPRDGRFKLMEINARHWLWHSLAAASGVNLSYVAYRDAIERPFRAPQQTDGPRWILTLKDVIDSAREIRRGQLSAGDWLSSLRGTALDGVLALDDPLPGAIDTWRWARRALSRRLSYVRNRRPGGAGRGAADGPVDEVEL